MKKRCTCTFLKSGLGVMLNPLVCYAFDFSFRFKKPEERQVLHRIMQVLLPQLYSRFTMVIEDGSQPSVEIQKQILKIFFALIQVSGCLKTDLHVYCKLLPVSPLVVLVDPSDYIIIIIIINFI